MNVSGILGDGQLARMLANAAHDLKVPLLLFGKKDSPAGQVISNCQENTSDEGMKDFFSRVVLCAIESEFVDADKIAAAGGKIKIKPNLSAIRLLQNKLSQKTLLKKNHLPTSEFFECKVAPPEFLKNVSETFKKDFVLKFATLGYDGKGVYVNQKNSKLDEALNFLENAASRKISVYAERKVSFKRELAMAATVDTLRNFAFYPLVVSEQQNGICDFVYGPATLFGATEQQEKQAQEIMREVARATGITGTFAVEFFETDKGELLINEIAPRVHNSAHYTMNGCKTSQFENHWRAILDLKLGSTEAAPFFAMANLLGKTTKQMDTKIPTLAEPFYLHWYGKKESRPGRKMGHINTWSSKTDDHQKILKNLRKVRDKWQNERL